MKTTDKTVTVSGMLGDREITRGSFIDQWVSHGRQVISLVDTPEAFEEYERYQEWIKHLAGQEWDRLYVIQSLTKEQLA